MSDSIKDITGEILEFTQKRGWYETNVADLRGMAISISVEASELLEHFQWTKDDSIDQYVKEHHEDISDELCDVLIYAFQFAHQLDIDLPSAIRSKMKKNGEKYPV